VVLLDLRLPGMDGIEVLERIKTLDDRVEVILVTAVQTVRSAVAAMKLGAFDYLTKPFEEEEILPLVRRAVERQALDREVVYLRSELAREHDFEELVGQSPVMQQLYQLVATVARNPLTVLIVGENGTGKELVARAIHRQGPRRDGPFVPVNVAAISDTLIESELFGHEKGAFTGASSKKLGRFELAHGGTLFLDEIATLRVDLQAKILRVLQEREVERVGGTRRIPIDVRVIAATNADLRRAIQAGALREDLYYRLNVVTIPVPPLHERAEDVLLLANAFLRRFHEELGAGRRIRGFSPEAIAAMRAHRWPGNVRELENRVQRALIVSAGPLIVPSDLELAPAEAGEMTLRAARDRAERGLVLEALVRCKGNVTRAAREIDVSRPTFHALMNKFGLRTEEFKD
jgi:two-component system response regulator AtoC